MIAHNQFHGPGSMTSQEIRAAAMSSHPLGPSPVEFADFGRYMWHNQRWYEVGTYSQVVPEQPTDEWEDPTQDRAWTPVSELGEIAEHHKKSRWRRPLDERPATELLKIMRLPTVEGRPGTWEHPFDRTQWTRDIATATYWLIRIDGGLGVPEPKPAPGATEAKPPIGPMPESVFLASRLEDLVYAIGRYQIARLAPSQEWLDEATRLIGWFRENAPEALVVQGFPWTVVEETEAARRAPVEGPLAPAVWVKAAPLSTGVFMPYDMPHVCFQLRTTEDSYALKAESINLLDRVIKLLNGDNTEQVKLKMRIAELELQLDRLMNRYPAGPPKGVTETAEFWAKSAEDAELPWHERFFLLTQAYNHATNAAYSRAEERDALVAAGKAAVELDTHDAMGELKDLLDKEYPVADQGTPLRDTMRLPKPDEFLAGLVAALTQLFKRSFGDNYPAEDTAKLVAKSAFVMAGMHIPGERPASAMDGIMAEEDVAVLLALTETDVRAAEDRTRIPTPVQHCSWCPDPASPDPANHPDGQLEHIGLWELLQAVRDKVAEAAMAVSRYLALRTPEDAVSKFRERTASFPAMADAVVDCLMHSGHFDAGDAASVRDAVSAAHWRKTETRVPTLEELGIDVAAEQRRICEEQERRRAESFDNSLKGAIQRARGSKEPPTQPVAFAAGKGRKISELPTVEEVEAAGYTLTGPKTDPAKGVPPDLVRQILRARRDPDTRLFQDCIRLLPNAVTWMVSQGYLDLPFSNVYGSLDQHKFTVGHKGRDLLGLDEETERVALLQLLTFADLNEQAVTQMVEKHVRAEDAEQPEPKELQWKESDALAQTLRDAFAQGNLRVHVAAGESPVKSLRGMDGPQMVAAIIAMQRDGHIPISRREMLAILRACIPAPGEIYTT